MSFSIVCFNLILIYKKNYRISPLKSNFKFPFFGVIRKREWDERRFEPDDNAVWPAYALERSVEAWVGQMALY